MREAPGNKQPVWNRRYSAWSEVLGADSGEVLSSAFTAVYNQTWWFTSQLLVTSLTSWAHSIHMMRRERWWAGVQSCATVTFCIISLSGWPWQRRPLATGDMSYLSLIHQNAPPLSQDYPGERAEALLSLCKKVWSFHTCLVTPALPSGLPWTVGLAKWQGMAGRQVPRDTERS